MKVERSNNKIASKASVIASGTRMRLILIPDHSLKVYDLLLKIYLHLLFMYWCFDTYMNIYQMYVWCSQRPEWGVIPQ